MPDGRGGGVSDGLKIRVSDEAGRAVCYVAGELDATTAPALKVVLNERLDAGQDAVVDMSAVTFVDSSGLGVLAGALRRFEQTGHRLSLREPNSSLRRVFETTGLRNAFPIE